MSLSGVLPVSISSQGGAPGSLADFAPQSILALAAEPRRAAAVLIEPVDGICRMVGWHTVELSERASADESKSAVLQAVRRLENQFNISLWDGEVGRPLLHRPGEAVAEGVGQAFAVADLQAPLRVWLAGLSGGGSLAAGEAALAGALCNPVATYLPGPQQSAGALTREFEALRPDIILVVGGHERVGPGSPDGVLRLSGLVIEAASRLPTEERPLFCFAGNSESADAALASWRQRTGGGSAVKADNVFNGANGRSATALHSILERLHWQRSLAIPAMQEIARWLEHPVELSSTQWAFTQAVRLWRRRQRLPSLHGLYAAADRWLHVWAWEMPGQEREGLRMNCVRPGERPEILADWPPVRLVSGDWPTKWPRPTQPPPVLGSRRPETLPAFWWDPLGLVPVVASVGQTTPEAVLEVLTADILLEDGTEFATV